MVKERPCEAHEGKPHGKCLNFIAAHTPRSKPGKASRLIIKLTARPMSVRAQDLCEQGGGPGFHSLSHDRIALRPQKRGCLLGTGTGGGGVGRGRKSEGSTADAARKGPEGPWTAARSVKAVSPRH